MRRGRLRPAVAALLAALLLAMTGSPAPASDADGNARDWEPPAPLTTPPMLPLRASAAMTAGGEAIAAWGEVEPSGAPVRTPVVRVATRTAGGPLSVPQTLDWYAYEPQVAANASGAAIIAWSSDRDVIPVAERLPDGSFGAPYNLVFTAEGFDRGPVAPRIAMNARGDVVMAYYQLGRNPERFQPWVIWRPAGGDWSEPEPIYEVSPRWLLSHDREVAISDNGEFAIGWSHGTLDGVADKAVMVTGKVEDGPGEPQVFEDPDHEQRTVDLAVDATGRMAFVWHQLERDDHNPEWDSYTGALAGRALVARREPGEPFGPPAAVPQSGEFASDAKVGLDDDGNLTFAFIDWHNASWIHTALVVSGPFDGPFGAPFKPIGDDHAGAPYALELDVAGSGAALVSYEHFGFPDLTETVTRPPDGLFGARQDLHRTCDDSVVHAQAIDDLGRAAVVADEWSTRFEAFELFVNAPADAERARCNVGGGVAREGATPPPPPGEDPPPPPPPPGEDPPPPPPPPGEDPPPPPPPPGEDPPPPGPPPPGDDPHPPPPPPGDPAPSDDPPPPAADHGPPAAADETSHPGTASPPAPLPDPQPEALRDERAPRLVVAQAGARRFLRRGRALLTVGCDEACGIHARGDVVFGRRGHLRVFRTRRNAAPGEALQLSLRISRARRLATLRRLRRGATVHLRVRLRAVDAFGNHATGGMRLRLRR